MCGGTKIIGIIFRYDVASQAVVLSSLRGSANVSVSTVTKAPRRQSSARILDHRKKLNLRCAVRHSFRDIATHPRSQVSPNDIHIFQNSKPHARYCVQQTKNARILVCASAFVGERLQILQTPRRKQAPLDATSFSLPVVLTATI